MPIVQVTNEAFCPGPEDEPPGRTGRQEVDEGRKMRRESVCRGTLCTRQALILSGALKGSKALDFRKAQAKVQAEAMQDIVKAYDDASRKELATKGDLQDAKHEILTWVVGVAVGQAALILAVVALIRQF